MTLQTTQTSTRQRADRETGVEPAGNSGPDLGQQASAYAQVARDALEECERGANAEQELHRRRNRPGQ